MKEFEAPVEALDEKSLEQVSGGGVDPLAETNFIAASFSTFQSLANGVLSPWVSLIDESAFKIRYRKPLQVLATYNNNTKYTMEEKAAIYATGWNELHPHQEPMTANTALYLLSIKDPTAQAVISCIETASGIEEASIAYLSQGTVPTV